MGGRAVWGFFLAAMLAVSAGAVDSNGRTGTPGTLNYVEGTASIGNEAVDSKSIGNALLQPGQSLTTETGKAELLLTPGVFLRVGNASSVKMISPSLTDTELELLTFPAIGMRYSRFITPCVSPPGKVMLFSSTGTLNPLPETEMDSFTALGI